MMLLEPSSEGTIFVLCVMASLYVAIPVLSIFISGRKVTWRGWVIFILIWPVGWLFINEELP